MMKQMILTAIALFALIPSAFAEGPTFADIPYGPGKDEKIDVYAPGGNAQNAPVIFMVHGGGWRHGDKEMSRVIDNKVARWVPMGFVFISVNYPMLPETDVAGQVAEVGKALQFAQQNAGKWGGDRNEFILMGHSAGAHIVSMLSAQNAAAIRGTVSLDSGALDVAQIMKLPHLRLYDDAFGTDPAYWAAMSPTLQMKAGGAPWLGVCSSSRKISCPQNQAYAKRAGELGIRAAVLPIDKSHGEINADLGADAAYTKNVEGFMATLSPAFTARFTSDAPFAAGDEKVAPKRGILRERLRERLTGRTQ